MVAVLGRRSQLYRSRRDIMILRETISSCGDPDAGFPSKVGRCIMSDELKALLESRRGRIMTPREREEQVISFAYGNVHYENRNATREGVARHSVSSTEGVVVDAGISE
jgi:hypothetical protein